MHSSNSLGISFLLNQIHEHILQSHLTRKESKKLCKNQTELTFVGFHLDNLNVRKNESYESLMKTLSTNCRAIFPGLISALIIKENEVYIYVGKARNGNKEHKSSRRVRD